MGGLITQLAKTMCCRNMSIHLTGEWTTDFMALFSLRLRDFAVSELWFLVLIRTAGCVPRSTTIGEVGRTLQLWRFEI
jgi:hypothetical protein